MVRTPFIDKNGLKKGVWSPEEDHKLIAYIQSYGHWNWRQLPKFAGLSRCGKSCRLRWMNYLRPGVKHGNFSKQEGDLIVKLHEQLGNKWSMIAAKLPGRTDNEVKNYWHTHLKKPKTSGLKDLQILTSLNDVTEKRQAVEAMDPPHLILESSSISPQILPNNKNLISHERVSQESSGDFWTEPFVLDSTYNQDCHLLSLHDIEGFISPHDDSSDLIYQVMQEFQNIH